MLCKLAVQYVKCEFTEWATYFWWWRLLVNEILHFIHQGRHRMVASRLMKIIKIPSCKTYVIIICNISVVFFQTQCTPVRNLASFRPVTPQFTRLNVYRQASISTRVSLIPLARGRHCYARRATCYALSRICSLCLFYTEWSRHKTVVKAMITRLSYQRRRRGMRPGMRCIA